MRSLGILLVVLVFAFSVFNGFREGPNLLGDALNTRQYVVAVGQVFYAVTALLALIGLWRRRPWVVTITAAWAVATTLVGAVASVAWSDAGLGTALVAGLATAIVVGLVVWFVRYWSRSWPT